MGICQKLDLQILQSDQISMILRTKKNINYPSYSRTLSLIILFSSAPPKQTIVVGVGQYCFFISKKCSRAKMKTRKKSRQVTRCVHEIFVGLHEDGEHQQEDVPGIEEESLQCCNCKRSFSPSSGGKCTDCKSNTIVYCSRACQVIVQDQSQSKKYCT